MNRLLSLPILAAAVAAGAARSQAPTELRISFIPDQNVATLEKIADKITAYLSKETGVKVVYEKSADYQACVNGLAANKLDMVWFGGVTLCQADERTKGKTVVVACRDIDLKFKSYLIASKDALDKGLVKPVEKLADLKAQAKGLKFTFGAKDSTSGHIMPRHFLVEAGLDPETAFAGKPEYSGNHNNTFTAVTTGAVDLGAINYTVWDAKKEEDRKGAKIVFTTPAYVDYCFAAHNRLGDELIGKLRAALVKLDAKDPAHKEVLDAWKCKQFVAADGKQWDGIRSVLKSLPKDFLQ